MKYLVFVCSMLVSGLCWSEILNYNMDLSKTPDMDPTDLEICGFPSTFSMDQAAPIGPTFLKELYYSPVTFKRIQSSAGEISDELNSLYTGKYRDKVYIVEQLWDHPIYAPGIYYRYEMRTYGSTSAPKGFSVSTELLNHRYSAEMVQGSNCGYIYYKLIQ